MAEFPLLKMINIDGRQTPFVYPQHKTLDGYKETGEENPLPTASYGMTESGVWIPQRVSDDGAVNTQVTGSMSEKEGVFERGIYNETLQKSIHIPKRAFGAMFHTRVRSLTGDVSNGGVSLDISLSSVYSMGYYYLFNLNTETINRNESFHSIIIQKKPDIADVKNNLKNHSVSVGSINLGVFDQLRYRVNIGGDDVEADVESFVKWLY